MGQHRHQHPRFTCAPHEVIIASLLFFLSFLQTATTSPRVVINNNVHSLHSFGNTLKDTTLDKIKLIRHIPSGKCLILENRDPAVGKHGEKVVLWECHDVKHIAGLEQEMFTLVRGFDNGFMMMGLAGSLNHCPFVGREYYDTLEIGKCDPANAYQSWTFRRLPGTIDSYQIIHLVTGRCLRVPDSPHDAAWVRAGDCDINDPMQTWRVCGLDNDCTFTI